jgi:Spy/CpxP family protein refolding chaperone
MTGWLKAFEETQGKPATDRELELAAREAMARLIQTEVYDEQARVAAEAQLARDSALAAREAERLLKEQNKFKLLDLIPDFLLPAETVPDL